MYKRQERNPWNALNTSALWQIVSLAPADGVYRDRNYDGEAVYELKARADNGEDLWFAASLLFDHSGERPIQIQSWSMGTKAEIDSAGGGADPQQLDGARYGLYSGEAAFLRDGWNTPIGPGMDLSFSCLDTGSCETEQLEDYEPIYHDGDYWYRVSANYPTGTFTALCYHSAADDADSIHTLEASMSDLYTPRGIRVGASRAEVLAAHPEALTGDYWGQYPEEPDLLAYLPWSGHDPEQISDLSQLEFYQGLGPAILFFFDGDTVERIVLTNMFN